MMSLWLLPISVSLVLASVMCSTTERLIDEAERKRQSRLAYDNLQLETLQRDIDEQRRMIGKLDRDVIHGGKMDLDDEITMCVNKIKRLAGLYMKHANNRDRTIKYMLEVGRFNKGSGSESTRVEIIDMPERSQEDVVHIAHKFAAAIGVAQYGGIVSAYRANSEDMPRPIVVQLASHHHKDVWLQQAEQWHDNVTCDMIDPSYGHQPMRLIDCVSEHLWKLYTVADIVAKQRGYMQVRVFNDTVEVQRDPWHLPLLIRTPEDLRVFEKDAPSLFLNQIELGGIPEREDEVPLVVARRVERALGVYNETAILIAFRRPTDQLPRPIIVVLRNATDKDFWLEQRGVHNLTADLIDPSFPLQDIIIDDLSMVDGQMYAECSLVAKEKGYASAFTHRGRIYIQYNDTVEPIEIFNKNQLHALKDETTEPIIIV